MEWSKFNTINYKQCVKHMTAGSLLVPMFPVRTTAVIPETYDVLIIISPLDSPDSCS